MEVLVGQHIVLRPLCTEYIDAYLFAFSPIVRETLHVTSTASERLYLNRMIARKPHFFYVIFTKDLFRIIGTVAIRNPKQYPGQLYIWLNELFWENGYFQEAVELLSKHYFAKTNEDSFTAHVDIANERSYLALKKAGGVDSGSIDGPYGKQYVLLFRK